jgi:hypothetical protein
MIQKLGLIKLSLMVVRVTLATPQYEECRPTAITVMSDVM